MPEPILRYAVAAGKMTREEFEEVFPHAVFVIEPFTALGDTGFQTRVVPISGTLEGITVATLAKKPGANAFSSMITIGRAGNNDIELKHASISKFHAYVTAGPNGGQVLVDAGSKYGTFAGETQLAPRTEKRPLESGLAVRFASLSATFYTASDLYGVLEEANRYGEGRS